MRFSIPCFPLAIPFYTCFAIATAFLLPLSTAGSNILFWLCPLLFFITPWRSRFLMFLRIPALYFMVILFIWMLVAVVYTVAPALDALKELAKYDKLVLGVFFAPAFFQEKYRTYALHAFLLAMAVTIMMGFCKEAGLITSAKEFGRFLVFKDRIQTSFLLAFSTYFSLLLFFSVFSDKAWGKIKYLYLLFALLSGFFLFSIGGRSGYVVFLILLIWLLWNRWQGKGLLIALALSILCLLSAYSFSVAFNARLQESIHDMQVYQQGKKDTSLGLRYEFV